VDGVRSSCSGCGAEVFPEDRFCEACGRRQPTGSDHTEHDLGAVAGVSDRGHRHHRNEDAFAVRTVSEQDTVIAVVCDGVSTSDRPDQAARVAADTAAELLVDAVGAGAELTEATRDAVAAAGKAVIDLGTTGNPDDKDNAPACTYVSSVVTADTVAVGWIGDSRAYWLAADQNATPSTCLTVDDSWALEMVTAGRMTAAQAIADPRAHALTGWLGADAEPDQRNPRVVAVTPTGPGVVLLCSDGLWNYLADAGALAALAGPAAIAAPLAAARTLVQYALECGGHDNITAVVVPFPSAGPRRTTT
jgi:serine/threonine protein phosphatase PrpC